MSWKFDMKKAMVHRLFVPAVLLTVIVLYLFNSWFVGNQGVFIVLGLLLTFIIPGYAWGLALIRTDDILERIVLSSAFSIAGIILTLLVLNLILRIPLNAIWFGLPVPVLDAIALSLLGLGYWLVKK